MGAGLAITDATLSSTSGLNTTNDQLAVTYGVTNPNGSPVQTITNWSRNGASITRLKGAPMSIRLIDTLSLIPSCGEGYITAKNENRGQFSLISVQDLVRGAI